MDARLNFKDGKWQLFDCCARCSFDKCEATWEQFSEEDNQKIVEMTDEERDSLSVYVKDGMACMHPLRIDWEKEMQKCLSSPYYFYTKYFQVNGQPVTTHFTEEEFNKLHTKMISNKDIQFLGKNRRR